MKRSMIYSAITIFALGSVTACAPTDKQIADWVEKNPEVILKSVEAYSRKQREDSQPKPEMATTFKADLFEHSGSPTFGKGPIKIAYFFDFNCGYCHKQHDVLEDLAKTRGSEFTVIYKNFPILSPSSELAAKAALSASLQGKYKEFYDGIYATKDKDMKTMTSIAKKLKLDMKKWETDMDGDAVKSELQHVRDLATKMKIGGTPLLAMAPNTVIPGFVQDLSGLITEAEKAKQ